MSRSIALSGDSIINRRISKIDDPGLADVRDLFTGADVGFTHFETLIHDFDGEGVYAPAEPGEMAMRSPRFVAEELDWFGVDLVSHASNHALDYGYGALRSTRSALEAVDIPLAGTGENLADARGPAFLDSSFGRVGLVSATTSFTRWSRAGVARWDHRGRPGLNPLGFHYEVDSETLDTVKSLAKGLGLWITELADGEWAINPPGLHNTLTRFVKRDEPGTGLAVDERDREGNLRAVRDAARQSDFVVFHLHTHAWDPDRSLAHPPSFVEQFTHDCVDAGADLVIAQGSHAPLRGIEIYDGAPIFYDPGDLMLMIGGVPKQPMEFYRRFEHNLDVDPALATIADVYDARTTAFNTAENPPGGYQTETVDGFVVPVCEFDDDFSLEAVRLHPGKVQLKPQAYAGVPRLASRSEAVETLDYLGELSAEYGTSIEIDGSTGIVSP